MFDGGESSPLVGQEMTTLSDTTSEPFLSRGKHDWIEEKAVLAFGLKKRPKIYQYFYHLFNAHKYLFTGFSILPTLMT